MVSQGRRVKKLFFVGEAGEGFLVAVNELEAVHADAFGQVAEGGLNVVVGAGDVDGFAIATADHGDIAGGGVDAAQDEFGSFKVGVAGVKVEGGCVLDGGFDDFGGKLGSAGGDGGSELEAFEDVVVLGEGDCVAGGGGFEAHAAEVDQVNGDGKKVVGALAGDDDLGEEGGLPVFTDKGLADGPAVAVGELVDLALDARGEQDGWGGAVFAAEAAGHGGQLLLVGWGG